MLYTLSKAQYDTSELENILINVTEQDAVLLWQDGVLQAVRSSQLFAKITHLFVLDQDVVARGLTLSSHFKRVSLQEVIAIADKYYPQIAL
ncbi:sulfurtransferase complex subunit TusB [Pasteurella atlantica]|uniref:sulfurtransferase complex subunit TusB n=1 Tax=Pasteurellaceae TaxID=712 RepID=UPI002774E0D6|nr:sulfurtransferase complex subunit TusB [Pasteurella atlantica]MDP8033755.1 sulfurtransferase complex subunit TusB [Pasteurella atlantica]MDP8035690.1 sulfurtransferase complex subunit TusB [Pasteurella atlantica]MDP8037629.1 sulfurtransferase complex subunit TusB [Pasteurella atlantica]MDP8047990.1 sulfurtransferase complex subunit TusB [Pasteurella atlantica]MDP8049945.1 sulfurtransferase complex subunit TusB [Pasteurella atlantica]